MTVEELNQKFLDVVEGLKSQPTGAKTRIVPKLKGVPASEKAAELHSKFINDYNLKANFEKLGITYSIAPALLAGIASRESNMGTTLIKPTSIYWGWGDYGTRTSRGEKHPTYHGFGVLQLDRIAAPFSAVTTELNRSLGKIKLNPYEERWLEWGVKTFMNKLDNAGTSYPKLAASEQFATALSKYNGGRKGFYYPENDAYTTGKDYANDTLARARWYANNWSKI
ncbi:MAG: hypothetical protein ACR2N3_05270 [Pyrinomonadaceae bacterium]